LVGVKIGWVANGPEREAVIRKIKNLKKKLNFQNFKMNYVASNLNWLGGYLNLIESQFGQAILRIRIGY